MVSVFVQPYDLAGVYADTVVSEVTCAEVEEVVEHFAVGVVEKALFLALVENEAEFALCVSRVWCLVQRRRRGVGVLLGRG